MNLHQGTNIGRRIVDAKELDQAAEIEIIGPTCPDCRGVQTTETTPAWVYRQRDICTCNEGKS